jgi:acetyl-CoA acetyltransferase
MTARDRGATAGVYGIDRQVAVVGVGESTYYKRGGSPFSEFRLALIAILAAAEDAGVDVRDLDGFCSYSDDRNTPTRLAQALGCRDVGYSNMVWGGGGGGGAGAVGNAAAALLAGYARYVVVYRSLAQGQFSRFGQAPSIAVAPGARAFTAPYGLFTPAQRIAIQTRRFQHQHGIGQDPLAAIALASYRHAQSNPRAVMYGRPLTRERYDASRWIAEPFHLFDCCQENDGAAALILTTSERADDLPQPPVYVVAAAQGLDPAYVDMPIPASASANFTTVGPRLWNAAGVAPSDVDVAQVYENFTGGTMMSLVENGFCTADEVEEFCTLENLSAPTGRLPLNTSGGNLAECYTHGLELATEAVRQVRGTSTAQVPDVHLSFVAAGPVTSVVSNVLFSD